MMDLHEAMLVPALLSAMMPPYQSTGSRSKSNYKNECRSHGAKAFKKQKKSMNAAKQSRRKNRK